MGFRGFSDFNKALLGKHCWRLINGESSLLESILKERYYPRVCFWRQEWDINQAMLGEALSVLGKL